MAAQYEELQALLRSVNSTMEKVATTFAAMNSQPAITGPVPTQGVPDQGSQPAFQRRVLNLEDQMAVRAELRKKSTRELHAMFLMQAAKRNSGIPWENWMNAGGPGMQQKFMEYDFSPEVRRALDTTGGSALIRQDLEPILYELYVRQFPAFERTPKEPANGLVHAYNQITSFGGASWMAELGTVADDKNTYVRKTTNVGIAATRRGISLKSGFAVIAGGMNYDPEQLELTGGLRAIQKLVQDTMFGYTVSDSGGTSTNESGSYDLNGFDGYRYGLRDAAFTDSRAIINVDPTASTPEDMRSAIDRALTPVADAGGEVSILWIATGDKTTFDLQQDKNVRYMNTFVDVAPGVVTNAVNTVFGPLPLAIVKGTSISKYETSSAYSGAAYVRDIYALDESTNSMPYLGSEGPTVLDIPIGVSGQLAHLFILFGMWGLKVGALPFNTKIRVHQ